MSSSVPTVEERLRSSRVLCEALRHIELLADQGRVLTIRGFTPRRVLRLMPSALEVLRVQLTAIETALPPAGLNAEAPLRTPALERLERREKP